MSIFLLTENYAVFFFSKVVFPNKMFALVINSFSSGPQMASRAISILGYAFGYCCHFLLLLAKQSKMSVQMFTRHRAGGGSQRTV